MVTVIMKQRKIKVNPETLIQQALAMLESLKYEDFDLGIVLTTNITMKKYNDRYRGKDKPTDILSFPFHALSPGERIIPSSPDDKNLGDIIISLEYVHKDAPRWDQTFEERLTTLLAHGIAHLLGYDHIEDEDYKIMQKVEKRLIRAVKKRFKDEVFFV